jgi:hypothetical protein
VTSCVDDEGRVCFSLWDGFGVVFLRDALLLSCCGMAMMIRVPKPECQECQTCECVPLTLDGHVRYSLYMVQKSPLFSLIPNVPMGWRLAGFWTGHSRSIYTVPFLLPFSLFFPKQDSETRPKYTNCPFRTTSGPSLYQSPLVMVSIGIEWPA